MTRKKYSRSLSRQSSDTEPSTKLVLVSSEPLLYLEFNKPNKQNVYDINSFKKFNSSQSQNNFWNTDWCQEWHIETSLQSVKINTQPCFPMRMFQSVSGHSSEQSIAHYSSRPTVSQLKGISDTISNWFENHQPQRTQISAPFIQNSNRMASRLTATASFPGVFFNSCNMQGSVQTFRLTGLLWLQKLTWLFQHFL